MAIDIIWLGVALLLAPALAELAKIRGKNKGFTWIGAGGAMYLLAGAFMNDLGLGLGETLKWGTTLFGVIGLIAVLIGTIVVLTGVFK